MREVESALRSARREGLEAAAMRCTALSKEAEGVPFARETASECAAAIRALIEQKTVD